jgi:hypothetical protein
MLKRTLLVAAVGALVGCQAAATPCPDAPTPSDCPECKTAELPGPAAASAPKKASLPPGHEPVQLKVKVPNVALKATPGQRVFAPYRSAFKKKAKSFDLDLRMRAGIIRSVGTQHSLIENDTMAVASIPNPFVVLVPMSQSAKPGEVILLHKDGGNMKQRAMVVAGGSESAPMTRELSTWKAQDPERAKAGTFIVLKPWGPGTHLACELEGELDDVTVLRVVDEQVIGLDWSGTLRFDDKSSCTPVPIHPKLTVGQAVHIPVVDDYHPATVLKVDEDAGYAEVEYTWGSSKSTNKEYFGEILTQLPK